ncbi:MAG TPA: hypothetical protein VNV65_09735 [Candidatus Solibacter sp.]|nr:hypothetical protein [Candidatus Solibacter sp.]
MPKQAGGSTRSVPPVVWVLGYAAVWGLVALLPLDGTDLDQFFWPSARTALAGHPLLVYQAAGQLPYPNANGPLSLLPLALAGMAVNALHWMGSIYLRRLVALPLFSAFVLLMAREAVIAVDKLRDRRLTGRRRLLAYVAFAAAPPVWHSVAGYGHIEQPIEIWLALLAARWASERRPVAGGAMLGLAALARSSAAVLAIPIALSRLRRGGGALVLLATAAVTAVVGLAPFYLADPADVTHSLLTYRGNLEVGAGSIWNLAQGTTWEPIAQHWDFAFVLALVAVINVWLTLRPGGISGGRLYAGMALSAAAFALLAKTVWPYYFLEVYVFSAVWALGRTRASAPALLLPLVGASALDMLAEVGSAPHQTAGLVRLEAIGMFALLGAAMAWLVVVSSREVRVVPPELPGSGGTEG